MKHGFAISFAIAGTLSFWWPNYSGFMPPPDTPITAGEGRIISAILWVGAAILWCMPNKKDPDG